MNLKLIICHYFTLLLHFIKYLYIMFIVTQNDQSTIISKLPLKSEPKPNSQI